MNARFICATALAALAAIASSGAGADGYHVVYNATITDGSDADDIFGLAGQSLVGLGITADVTYLTSVAGTRTRDAVSDEVTGGDAFFTPPVISSAVFTIGTKSFSFSPSLYGDVYTSAGYLDAYGLDTLGNNFETYIVPNLSGPASLDMPFSSSGVGDADGRTTQYSFAILGSDLIDFDATYVTVAAVPEPAAWTIMLAGLGTAGGAMRCRRRRVTALA